MPLDPPSSEAARRSLSIAWSGVNRVARWARDRKILLATRLPARTIGIGNVQAGGTGKTPLTAKLANEAAVRGLSVAILTRGYGSRWENEGGILHPDEAAPSPALCGDEAALLHERAPKAWIGVGADRVARFEALRAAVAQRGMKPAFDLVFLDDAFQHWRIHCDLHVVAITDAAPGEAVFRDFYSAVGPRDIVVLTKGERFPSGLAAHPNRVRARFRLEGSRPDTRYRFVAAIGDPARARVSLEAAGFAVAESSLFPDHHAYVRDEADRILEQARIRGERVLLTGKDWVKWRALGISQENVTVVEPEIEIVEGGTVWDRILG